MKLADVMLSYVCAGASINKIKVDTYKAAFVLPNSDIHPDTQNFWEQWMVDLFCYENWDN